MKRERTIITVVAAALLLVLPNLACQKAAEDAGNTAAEMRDAAHEETEEGAEAVKGDIEEGADAIGDVIEDGKKVVEEGAEAIGDVIEDGEKVVEEGAEGVEKKGKELEKK